MNTLKIPNSLYICDSTGNYMHAHTQQLHMYFKSYIIKIHCKFEQFFFKNNKEGIVMTVYTHSL